MQGRRQIRDGVAFGLAPWIVAGALLFGASAPATAQDATPPPAEAGTEGTLPTTDAAADPATTDAVEVATDPAAAPAEGAAADPAADQQGNQGRGGKDGGQDVAAVPAVGVGPGTAGNEMNAVAIFTAFGAAAAGAAALRGRFSGR